MLATIEDLNAGSDVDCCLEDLNELNKDEMKEKREDMVAESASSTLVHDVKEKPREIDQGSRHAKKQMEYPNKVCKEDGMQDDDQGWLENDGPWGMAGG